MAHRRFVLLGAVGVTALVIALAALGLGDNLTYYLYPTEAVDNKADFADGRRFRLAGTVVEGTLSEEGGRLSFEVTDGGTAVPVTLTGSPPPLFGESAPVVLDGAWEGEIFAADSALVRHDENYRIPEEGNYGAPDG